jgi:hypothetical protein
MTIPESIYNAIFARGDMQENVEFDADGNELYRGLAPNNATEDDPLWIISKGIYTESGGIKRMTHSSFLRNQIWSSRNSVIFP